MSQTCRGAYESFRKDVLPGLSGNEYRLGHDIAVTYIPGDSIHVDLSEKASSLSARIGNTYEGFPVMVNSA